MRADGELLPSAVVRNIGDKLYEKRKTAALEVEQVRRATAAAGHPAGGSRGLCRRSLQACCVVVAAVHAPISSSKETMKQAAAQDGGLLKQPKVWAWPGTVLSSMLVPLSAA